MRLHTAPARRFLATARARRRLRQATGAAGSAPELDAARLQAEEAVNCLELWVGQPGGAAPDEVVLALNGLAALHEAAADLTSARVVLNHAVEVLTSTEGVSAAAHCATFLQRGTVLRLQARYSQASEDLAHAMDVAPDGLWRAAALNALGVLAKDTRRYQDAAACYDEALGVLEAHHGAGAVETAPVLHNLAGLHHAQGRFVEAEPYIRRALAARLAHVPVHRAALASDQGVLGALLAAQGRHDEATTLFLELLDVWTTLRGADHYEVGFCEHHLGTLSQARGDRAQAERRLRRALEIKSRLLPDGHPEVEAVHSALTGLQRDLS